MEAAAVPAVDVADKAPSERTTARGSIFMWDRGWGHSASCAASDEGLTFAVRSGKDSFTFSLPEPQFEGIS